MTTRLVAAVVAAATLGGLLAGCGDDPGVDQAEADYCDATDEVQAAFERFAGMDADGTSAADRQSARDDLADALGRLSDAATDVGHARSNAGNNPIDAYNQRIQDIDDDASITEVASEMARASGDFLGDVKDYLDDLECRDR